MIGVSGLSVAFRRGGEPFPALTDVSFDVSPGEIVGVVGPSGSGKTTLLNVLAGLLKPSGGEVSVDGESLYDLSDRRRTELRNQKIGLIFQTYHLHPQLTVKQNVLLPQAFGRGGDKHACDEIMERLDIGELANARAGQLSSGQKQRVVTARALVMRPEIVLADEPTANLDEANAQAVLETLRHANRTAGVTILLVAHDQYAIGGMERVLHLANGRLVA